jgi:phage protein D
VIRTALRRPLLVAAGGLSVLSLTGAGYSAATGPSLEPLEGKAAAAAAQQADAAATEAAFHQDVAADQQAARAAAIDAERQARAEAERKAKEEAEGKAREEAERKAREQAEAERRAAEEERRAVAERASRDAARNPKGVAAGMLGQFGWGAGQMDCLDSLWTKESNWDHTAANPSSSAFGIPQALPGSKMASAGADWATNPATQIRWGLGYIADVYGSPCAAWSHSQANNWY